MVRYETPSRRSSMDPGGVRVEYDSRGQPFLAVVEVNVRSGGESTKVEIEFEINEATARLRQVCNPPSFDREHLRSLPLATQQIENLDCVNRVERPEKTFGDMIMEGHRILSSEEI